MAPAVGDIRVKTYLMAVPFIKSIHHINIMHAASKWIFNSKLSVTIPRGTGRECCWSEMSQPSSLRKSLVVSDPACGVANGTEQPSTLLSHAMQSRRGDFQD